MELQVDSKAITAIWLRRTEVRAEKAQVQEIIQRIKSSKTKPICRRSRGENICDPEWCQRTKQSGQKTQRNGNKTRAEQISGDSNCNHRKKKEAIGAR